MLVALCSDCGEQQDAYFDARAVSFLRARGLTSAPSS
jgi:hypothetical protein